MLRQSISTLTTIVSDFCDPTTIIGLPSLPTQVTPTPANTISDDKTSQDADEDGEDQDAGEDQDNKDDDDDNDNDDDDDRKPTSSA